MAYIESRNAPKDSIPQNLRNVKKKLLCLETVYEETNKTISHVGRDANLGAIVSVVALTPTKFLRSAPLEYATAIM